MTSYLILPQLMATDADEGEFGRVWYRILHGEWAAFGRRRPAFLLLGWQSFSRLPRAWEVRSRKPQVLYTRAGQRKETGTFFDHLHQVGCFLSEGTAFDHYALEVPHVPQ